MNRRPLDSIQRMTTGLRVLISLLVVCLAVTISAAGAASAGQQPAEQKTESSTTKLQPELPKPETQQTPGVGQPSRGPIEVLPTEVELPPNGDVTVMLVLHNSGTDTYSEIQLVPFRDSGTAKVKIVSEPISSDVQRLDPRADLAWKLQLSNEGKDPISGTIYVELKYKSQVQGSSQAVPRVGFASIKVKSQDVEQLADVHINTTLESLEHEHPGKVYIGVTNKSNQWITVKDISSAGPDFISFDNKASKLPQYLAPRNTQAFQIDIKADKRVQPGKHLLVFTIQFEWGEDKNIQTRNLVATQEVKVGVLGESTVLQLLGVPSFLVLPGFLVLVIWGLLWTMGVRKSRFDTGQFPLQFSQQPANPQFWVVAITFSIIILAIYIKFYPDFLRIYGLDDIVLIWLISALVLGVGGYLLIANWRIYHLRRRTPAEADEPIDILEKLDRQGLGVFLDKVKVNVKPGDATETRPAFLLQENRDDRTTSWVGPGVLVTFKPEASQDLKDKIEEQRKHKRNAFVLAALLKEGLKNKALDINWKPLEDEADAISAPYEVKTTDIQIDQSDYFVSVAP